MCSSWPSAKRVTMLPVWGPPLTCICCEGITDQQQQRQQQAIIRQRPLLQRRQALQLPGQRALQVLLQCAAGGSPHQMTHRQQQQRGGQLRLQLPLPTGLLLAAAAPAALQAALEQRQQRVAGSCVHPLLPQWPGCCIGLLAQPHACAAADDAAAGIQHGAQKLRCSPGARRRRCLALRSRVCQLPLLPVRCCCLQPAKHAADNGICFFVSPHRQSLGYCCQAAPGSRSSRRRKATRSAVSCCQATGGVELLLQQLRGAGREAVCVCRQVSKGGC